MSFLVDKVPSFTGAYSVLPYSEGLHSVYRFVDKFGAEIDMSVPMGDTLQVPRESCPTSPNDYRVIPPAAAIDCKISPWNTEQLPLAAKSESLLRAGRSHVFEAPTGWGKTVVGSLIASRMQTPTMIVVTKTDLMDSWYAALTRVLGIDPSLVGKVQQDECSWEGKRFVVGMLHSLVLPDRYPIEMYKSFGLLILDEVHLMATEYFSAVCWKFPAIHRLGFSATPDRKDGRSCILDAHIGKTLVRGKLVPMKAKVIVRKTGWKIPEHVHYGPGRMMGVSKAMATSVERNMQIIEFVKSAFDAGRNIVIMSDLKDAHLNALFQLLTSFGIGGEHIGYYVGGMKKPELDFNKKKRVVLATYKMCSTGTDVPAWDTLVMATPRADVKQIVGRVLRTLDGKKQPVIFDMVDRNQMLQGFHMARVKQYYGIGAEIFTV